MFDFIIVGQGIAGTMLSWFLHRAGKSLLVIDDDTYISPSRITSGIINPVTGRRLVKTWLADDLLPFAEQTYRKLEVVLGEKFYEPMQIVRLFSSVKEQNDWSVRCATEEYGSYLKNHKVVRLDERLLNHPFGGFEISGTAHVHVPLLLDSFRSFLKSHQQFVAAKFDYTDVKFAEDSVNYRGVKARHLIFCEGVQATKNPFFQALHFQPAKGECLLVEINDFPRSFMLKGEVMVLPFYGTDSYYVGATHDVNFENELPTEKAKSELEEGLRRMIGVPYKIIDHWAAVRPTVNDRRPLIGVHPGHQRLSIFNGMGTKGVSLSPYFAHHFAQHLLHRQPLLPEVDIHRFLS